jgi:alkaline phosphatase D
MKIAFTSFFDVLDDPVQEVWDRISGHEPDVLLLLGDTIYMDFGLFFFSDHPLGRPRRWDNDKFAEEMYTRYQKQSQVESFRRLVARIPHLGAIWDDHDFAWNDVCGLKSAHGSSKNVAPLDKKLIARSLHMQFRTWLRTRPLPARYPEQPKTSEMLKGLNAGIQEFFDLGSVRFLMLDGRYFRETQNEPTRDPRGSFSGDSDDEEPDVELTSLLGEDQRRWLSDQVTEWPGLSVICSGQTLAGGKSDDWAAYADLEWLAKQRFERAIVLSGDIHDTRIKQHAELGGMWELTASGAARPGIGGDTGNFGIIEISDTGLEAQLHSKDGLEKTKRIPMP